MTLLSVTSSYRTENDTFAWQALLTLIGSTLLIVVIGSLLQFYDLAFGLLATELILIALPAGLMLRKYRGQVAPGLFRTPDIRQLLLTLLIALCTVSIATYKGIVSRHGILNTTPSNPLANGSLLLISTLVVIGPLCEEMLFRAIIQSGLQTLWRPRSVVIITALLFALFHLNLLRFAETFAIGFFAGIVFLKTRNLWCAVLLHAINNALGSFLFGQAPSLGWLLNPASCLGLTALAITSSYYLGAPSPSPLKGIRPRLLWALFGTVEESANMKPASSRRVLILTWSMVCSLLAVGGFSTFRALQINRSGNQNLQHQLNAQMVRFHYVVTENDLWIIQPRQQILAQSTLTFKKQPQPLEDFTITLPFSNATLLNATLNNQPLAFTQTQPARYRIAFHDVSALPNSTPLVITWTVPLSSLQYSRDGYITPIQSLLPSDYISIDVTTAPESGFRLLWNKGQPVQRICFITPDVIRLKYGTCSLGIEPTSH